MSGRRREKAELKIKGEIAEDYLYEFVNANRGLSIYELSKRVGWSTGKVYHIVKVLEDDGLVRTIKTEERGRIKRNVYPTSWKELLPEDVKNTLKNSVNIGINAITVESDLRETAESYQK